MDNVITTKHRHNTHSPPESSHQKAAKTVWKGVDTAALLSQDEPFDEHALEFPSSLQLYAECKLSNAE